MLIHSRTRALVRSGRLLHLLKMADNKDAGLPPLQDPNTPDNVCPICQGWVDSPCLACQEFALMRANSTTNQRDNSDSYTPQAMPDSDMSDSAYDADTIIDSPNSRSSTLQLNFSDNSNDENMLSDNNLNDEEIKEEPAPLMPRRRPIRNMVTVLFGACERGKTFKPLIDGNKPYRNLIGSDIVSNAVSNDPDDSDESDLLPLEGSDEDDGDL